MTDDRWHHNLCERCWFSETLHGDEHPRGRHPTRGYIAPVRLASDEDGRLDVCCHCGDVTVYNARTRQDATWLICGGQHDLDNVVTWVKPVVARHLPQAPV